MLRKSLLGIIALIGANAFAQQDPQYTQYMYNMLNVNPAYAGNRGVMSIFGLHRTQWVGLDGAPQTTVLSVHTPFENSKMGLGVTLMNDRLGVIDNNNINIDASYTLDLNDKGSQLSFGLRGTFNLMTVEYSRLHPQDVSDPKLVENIKGSFNPNVGAGIYWHNSKSYVGLSVPNFLKNTQLDESGMYSTMNTKKHYFLTAGHVFTVNQDLKIKPALLVKAVEGAPIQYDISSNFLIKNKLTLGAAWRFNALSAMVGYQVNDSFFIGYGYDSEVTSFNRSNSGSHELFIRYELFKKYKRINTPRFF